MSNEPPVGRWFTAEEQKLIKGMFGDKVDFTYAGVWNGALESDQIPGAKRFVSWVDVTGDGIVNRADVASSKRFIAIHYVFEATRNGVPVNHSYRDNFVPDPSMLSFDGVMRTFMHEVIHIWQFQNDIPRRRNRADYKYLDRIDFNRGSWESFELWGIEEQARYLQDIWQMSLGGDPHYYLAEGGLRANIGILHSIREDIRELLG